MCASHELWITTVAYGLRHALTPFGQASCSGCFGCLTASHNPTTAIALGKKRPPDVFYPASRNDAERGKGLREVCNALVPYGKSQPNNCYSSR